MEGEAWRRLSRIGALKKGPITAGHAAELAALPDPEAFYAEVRKVKSIPLKPVKEAVDAARLTIQANLGPHADLRRLGIERRGGLFEPDVMRRLVELWRESEPAFQDLLAFWRTANVLNVREIETAIQREALNSETPPPGEAEMITALKRMGLERRGDLFTPESRALLGNLWLEDNGAARGLLDYWRARKVNNLQELERLMKAEAEKIRSEGARTEAESQGTLVMVDKVNLPRMAAAVVGAIQAQMPDTIFRRNGEIVHLQVTKPKKIVDGALVDPGYCSIVPVDATWLGGTMQKHNIRFFSDGDSPGEIAPPWKLLERVLLMPDGLLFPELRNLSAVPTLTRQEPGYDPASELFLAFPKEAFPEAPENPTRADAEAAFARLSSPFRDYIFKDDASRAVALSGLMCAVARSSMQSCPLHAISAGNSGDGKTKIANMFGMIALGRKPAHMAYASTEEEVEKRITSRLMGSSTTVLSLDNIAEGLPLRGVFLCIMLTENPLETRRLGAHLNVVLDTTVLMIATGCKLKIVGDLLRRSVMCTIGTGAVANNKRVHTFDPVEEVAANRPQLVVDVLTIIHAWQAAGKPLPAGFRSIPSFEDYDLIRGPLLWLGQADPADSQKALFETETRLEERHTFLTSLYFKFSTRPFCARDLLANQEFAAEHGFCGFGEADIAEFLKTHAETLVLDLILNEAGKEKDPPYATLWKLRVIEESSTEY
jgi:hypothetical protein